jgi:hypothetical protein
MGEDERFFLYKPITKPQVEQLTAASTPEALRSALRTLFTLTATDEPTEILLDFHTRNFAFTRQHRFTLEKISCFLGIMDYVFHVGLNQRLTQTASYEMFRKCLLRHSAQRPPWSIAVFSHSDVETLTQFALTTFFRSYALYEHAFTPHTDMLLITGTRFESGFPPVQQLSLGSVIDPASVPELAAYLASAAEDENALKEEQAAQSISEKEESIEMDPFQQMVTRELKSLESALDEKMKKREEELLSKLAGAKK